LYPKDETAFSETPHSGAFFSAGALLRSTGAELGSFGIRRLKGQNPAI